MKITISFIILSVFLGLISASCKTKATYDELAYDKIMDESVQLFAKQDAERNNWNTMARDTTNSHYKKLKPHIDSVDAIHKTYFQDEKTNKSR